MTIDAEKIREIVEEMSDEILDAESPETISALSMFKAVLEGLPPDVLVRRSEKLQRECNAYPVVMTTLVERGCEATQDDLDLVRARVEGVIGLQEVQRRFNGSLGLSDEEKTEVGLC